MSKTTQFFILTAQNNSLEKNLMVLFLIWSIIRLLLNPFRLFRSFRSFRLFRSFRFVSSNIISLACLLCQGEFDTMNSEVPFTRYHFYFIWEWDYAKRYAGYRIDAFLCKQETNPI